MRKLSLMIFIVDDDRDFRDSLRFLLESEGWPSRGFATAREFLGSQMPVDGDILVTDMHMPGMSGLELLATIRKSGLALPVVLMTGNSNSALRSRALLQRATAFLEKPFRSTDILPLIRQSNAVG
ncbi:MAG: response regulator transcription factor [Pseudomonadota bacterium]